MKLVAFALQGASFFGTYGGIRAVRNPIRCVSSVRVPVAAVSVDREQVRKTAHLAQLDLSEDEISTVTPEFQKIISFIDRMSELDVDGIDPMPRPHDAENVTRDDTPKMFENV